MAIIGMFFQVGVSSRCCFLYNSDGSAALCFLCVAAVFSQDGLTGSAWGDWANYTASPLRAEPVSAAAAAAAAKAAAAKAGCKRGSQERGRQHGCRSRHWQVAEREDEDVPAEPSFDPANEVGVTEPFGYFDPAGFCKKGDKAGFRNLRCGRDQAR